MIEWYEICHLFQEKSMSLHLCQCTALLSIKQVGWLLSEMEIWNSTNITIWIPDPWIQNGSEFKLLSPLTDWSQVSLLQTVTLWWYSSTHVLQELRKWIIAVYKHRRAHTLPWTAQGHEKLSLVKRKGKDQGQGQGKGTGTGTGKVVKWFLPHFTYSG